MDILHIEINPEDIENKLIEEVKSDLTWNPPFEEQVFSFTTAVIKNHIHLNLDVDEGLENPFTELIRGILHTIVPLVAITILQQWLLYGNPPSWEEMASYALCLDFKEKMKFPSFGNPVFKVEPDFTIRGLDPSVVPQRPLQNRRGINPKIFIATLDSKNTSQSRKTYPDGAEHISKDDYITRILQSGGALPPVLPTSWKGQTHSLLAQVYLI